MIEAELWRRVEKELIDAEQKCISDGASQLGELEGKRISGKQRYLENPEALTLHQILQNADEQLRVEADSKANLFSRIWPGKKWRRLARKRYYKAGFIEGYIAGKLKGDESTLPSGGGREL